MALKKYKCQEYDPIGDFYNTNCIDYCEQYDRLFLNETYTGKDYGECVSKSGVDPDTVGAWTEVGTSLTDTIMGFFNGGTTTVYDDDGNILVDEESNAGTIIIWSLVGLFVVLAVVLVIRKRK